MRPADCNEHCTAHRAQGAEGIRVGTSFSQGVDTVNTAIVARLVWKEYRQLRSLFCAIAALIVLGILLSIVISALFDYRLRFSDLTIAFLGLALYALGCAAVGFALETEAGTRKLLHRYPLHSGHLLVAKVGFAFLSTVLLGVFIGGCLWVTGTVAAIDDPVPTAGLLRIVSIWSFVAAEFYAWTMLCALIASNTLTAACWGGFLAAVVSFGVWLVGWPPGVSFEDTLSWRMALLVVVLVVDLATAGRWLRCDETGTLSLRGMRTAGRWVRRLAVAATSLAGRRQRAEREESEEPLAAEHAGTVPGQTRPRTAEFGRPVGLPWIGRSIARRHSQWARLLWLHLRQYQGHFLSVLVLTAVNLGVAVAMWLVFHPARWSDPRGGVFWLASLLEVNGILALVLGATCFHSGRLHNELCFLAERPVVPGTFWWTKILPGITAVLALSLSFYLAAVASLGAATFFRWLGPILLFAFFASTQFATMATRSTIVGAFSGAVLVASIALALIWATGPRVWEKAEQIAGWVGLWSLPVLAAMLADTRLGVERWLHRRPRRVLWSVAGSTTAWTLLLVLVGIRIERVLSVPLPESAVFAAFERRVEELPLWALPASSRQFNEGTKTYNMYVDAVRAYLPNRAGAMSRSERQGESVHVEKGRGSESNGKSAWIGANQESLALLLKAARRRTYFDRAFSQLLELAEFHSAAGRPGFLGQVVPLLWRRELPEQVRAGAPWTLHAAGLLKLLLAKAETLREQGDLQLAWEHLFAAVMLVHRAEQGPLSCFDGNSLATFRMIYDHILRWAVAKGQNSRLIEKAMADLAAARGGRSLFSDRLVGRYYFLEQAIDGNPLATTWHWTAAADRFPVLKGQYLWLLTPGERTYLKRCLAQLATRGWETARRLDLAELGLAAGGGLLPSSPGHTRRRREVAPYAQMFQPLESIESDALNEMAYYRLTMLELAFCAYQLDRGGTLPGTLDELVTGGYLEQIPLVPGTAERFRYLPEGIGELPAHVRSELGDRVAFVLETPALAGGSGRGGLQSGRQEPGLLACPLLVGPLTHLKVLGKNRDALWLVFDWLVDANGNWHLLTSSGLPYGAIRPWPVLRPAIPQTPEDTP